MTRSTCGTCCTASASGPASTSASTRTACGTRSPSSWSAPACRSATISKLLGHSSIAVTSRYLDHLTNAAAIEALEAVELPALSV